FSSSGFMRTGIFTFLFCGIVSCVCAQSEPQFTQYMYNKYLFNPAYAGSRDDAEFSALYRTQYVELTDRPISTEGFNFNLPVNAVSSGIGLTAINDMIGYQRATYVAVDYD